ncbi:MAG: UvrB/UvrC motif-containing protein [bacterium]
MLCDLCHKEVAVIHWAVVINNTKTDLHLCETCAVKRGLISPEGIKLKELLPLIPHTPEVDNIKCTKCGLTIDDFRETSRLGCPNCYIDFAAILIPLLRHIHGSIEHIGKKMKTSKTSLPKKSDSEIKMLHTIFKEQLKESIAKENYEKAALIRDEIKKLDIE